MFYAPQTYAAMPGQLRFPLAKTHIGGRGLIRPPSVRGEEMGSKRQRESQCRHCEQSSINDVIAK